MINVDLLKKICETPGAPGYEQRIRELVLAEVQPLADQVSVDAMGNVVAIRKGQEGKRAMVAAHMDEIGFIVTHIDEDGFLRFHTLGGFDPKTLTSQRVIVHGKKDLVGVMGSKPIHLMKPEERNKQLPISEYYIDLGMSREEALKHVYVGAPVTRERELIEIGDCVNSKSLDNRVSVFILLETLRALKGKTLPYDLYAVFTVQEEVGLRGAISAAHHIDPDFGFGLDVTIAFDVPGAQAHEQVTALGKGAAIKIMDGSTICDYRMVDYMKHTAGRHGIPWQPEILPAGGTDTAGLQRYGKKGAIAGAISIPLRNMHQTIEMANKADVKHCIDLLTACVSELDQHDWSFGGAAPEHPSAYPFL
ncbi:M42 family metallopeptidase [Phaeodactylibacter luteus]|uniref:M42 family metallopeptidase n=1 Tax=Phaeodactylibacter luteus TaxID=1564516 RepID=A0A5C6RLT4_9BACT|nr:M42 family metallopeptidase [Phaeodactylibacter luteus]TXB63197.1 M42 family metallopeptidase [Phaeodactylibacter luteus]